MPAQAAGEPDRPAAVAAARSAALQPAERARVPVEGRVPAVLGLRFPDLGRQVPRSMVHQGPASRIAPIKKFARTVRNHRELLLNYFRAQKEFSSGVIEGLNDKAKVTIEKSVRLSELSHRRIIAIPRAWQTTRTKVRPRFLLTNQKKWKTPDAGFHTGARGPLRRRQFPGRRHSPAPLVLECPARRAGSGKNEAGVQVNGSTWMGEDIALTEALQ